jgi:hypothetical protein
MSTLRITNPSQDSRLLESIPILALILVLALVLGSGCSPSARPSDPSEGRKALQAMLDAWKSGAKPESFASQNPSIHASDGDWRSGLVLQNYGAVGEGMLVGSDLNYPVELVLKNIRGQVTKKNAVYAVTTHPQLLVLRTDE